MATETRKRKAPDLSEALDRAMQAFSRRDREPAAYVESHLERLHEAWAAVRFSGDDDDDRGRRQPADGGRSPSKPRRKNSAAVKRIASARQAKADHAVKRAAWVESVFDEMRPGCRSDREAHGQVVAEMAKHGWKLHPGSVKRILRRLGSR